jgi:hypothetical protein
MQPRLDTSVGGVTGHAHPLPSSTPQTPETEILEFVLAKVMMDVELRGLLTDGVKSAFELVFPNVRRSQMSHDAVQHLDVVSCWKGLQYSNAVELVRWDHLFRESLASHIKLHLLQDFAFHLLGCCGKCSFWKTKQWPSQDYSCWCDLTDVALPRIWFICGSFADDISEPTNETLLVPRIVDYLSHKQMGMLRILADDIVLSMISRFYDGSLTMLWSLGSGDLREHVHKIVRTYDCFLHGLDVCCVFFNITHSFVDGKLAVSATIDWQLPRITFSALPTELPVGDVYRIVPHFANPNIGAVSPRTCTTHEDSITYTITKSPLPLE